MVTPILVATDVTKRYGRGTRALSAVSLVLGWGRRTSTVAPPGSAGRSFDGDSGSRSRMACHRSPS